MFRRSTQIAAVFVCAAFVTSCGGDSPTGGNNNNNNNNNGTGTRMTATINGAAFASGTTAGLVNATQVSRPSGSYVIGGYEQLANGTLGRQVTFSLGHIAAPGSFPLGVDGVTVSGGYASVTDNGQWTTPFSGAAGSITITALTSTHITGTFSFTADAFSGPATGTKVVTNGVFDAPMTTAVTITPLADSIGSKLSATIGGSAFNASTVSGQTSTTNLVLLASNSQRSLLLTIPRPAGPGTYTLSNAAGSLLNLNDGSSSATNAPRCCYGIATDVGSITITSMTTTRVRGTFTATLTAKPGTAVTGTIAITNGSFDVGLYHN